jgi:hypothetical protein
LSELARVPWTNTDSYFTLQLPFQLDYETWYLGAEEDAPDGTTKPPSFVQPYQAALTLVATGLPVGGAVGVIIPEDEWDFGDLFGDLYVTAQIVTLVHAP